MTCQNGISRHCQRSIPASDGKRSTARTGFPGHALPPRSLQRMHTSFRLFPANGMPVRFQPERPAPGTHGLSALPPLACWRLYFCMTSADLWRLRSQTRNRTDGNKRSAASPREGGISSPCVSISTSMAQPRRRLPCSSSAVIGRHAEKSQVRQRYPAASVQQRKNAPASRIFSQRVTLMAAFSSPPSARHAACCSMLRGQCL